MTTYTVQIYTEARAAVVHLNFRAGSTFPILVCTLPTSMDRSSRCNKVDAVRLSYMLNLHLRGRGAWRFSPVKLAFILLDKLSLILFV